MADEFDGLDLAQTAALLRTTVKAQGLALAALGHVLKDSHAEELSEMINLYGRMAEVAISLGKPDDAEAIRQAQDRLINATEGDSAEILIF